MKQAIALLLALALTGAYDCRAESIEAPVLDGKGQTVAVDVGELQSDTDAGPYPWAAMDQLIVPESPFAQTGRFDQARPVGMEGLPMASDLMLTPSPTQLFKNGLSANFSSLTGGVGFRIGYDRRLSPTTRLIAGTEFTTFGPQQSFKKLGADLPANVTRVTLVATPVGLQRQFNTRKRVVPHLGFGVGPYVRFDHQAGPTSTYPGGIGLSAGTLGGQSGYAAGVGLPIDEFPQLSLTLGGFAAAGFDIRLGEKKELALTIDGRYTMARFVDALGSPGDLGGPGLAIGIGKYF
jgi:hypothetical protein